MSSRVRAYSFSRTIDCAPSEVFHAFTSGSALRDWFCDRAQLEPREGGPIYLAWNDGYYAAGEFLTVEPDRKLIFTWQGRGEPGRTEIQVLLEPREEKTFLTLTHRDVGLGPRWDPIAEQVERGWRSGLENLQSVLEVGEDLRITRRPMLGISGGDLITVNRALDFGLPPIEGIRIGGVIEGSGAEAAGLQPEDVLVELDGKEINGWNALSSMLATRRAGEKVELIVYRGKERKRVQLDLSPRAMPPLPATLAELVGAAQEMYADLQVERAALFEGVTDEMAEQKPAPGEWSAKEVLAHLIVNERTFHVWIALLVDGERLDNFVSDGESSVQSLLSIFPTLPALLDELERNESTTLAMVTQLPERFPARKRGFTRLAENLLFVMPAHSRMHFNQIRAALPSRG